MQAVSGAKRTRRHELILAFFVGVPRDARELARGELTAAVFSAVLSNYRGIRVVSIPSDVNNAAF